MKTYILSGVLALCINFVQAQDGLVAKKGDRGLYLEHKVAPKESFFSIGRLFNTHPKFIAAYNKLDMNRGLAIGQVLQIPLSDTNFIQAGNSGTPVYYKTSGIEGLEKISSNHKNVPVQKLREWNSVTDNTIPAGTNLVIGFLNSKEMTSVTLQPKPAAETVKTSAPEVKKEDPVPPEVKPVVPKTEPPKQTETVVVKPETKTVNTANGYFSNHFEQQVKQTPIRRDEMVTSGIFKTSSGWTDSKYYLLIDGVQPGTIIKITNPANSRFIFAKVLGEMTGIRQNDGLNIRISNAGATALQVSEEDKFIVRVNY